MRFGATVAAEVTAATEAGVPAVVRAAEAGVLPAAIIIADIIIIITAPDPAAAIMEAGVPVVAPVAEAGVRQAAVGVRAVVRGVPAAAMSLVRPSCRAQL